MSLSIPLVRPATSICDDTASEVFRPYQLCRGTIQSAMDVRNCSKRIWAILDERTLKNHTLQGSHVPVWCH
jgi:hypothetical protein